MQARSWNQFTRSCVDHSFHNNGVTAIQPTLRTTPVTRIGHYPSDHPIHRITHSQSSDPRVGTNPRVQARVRVLRNGEPI